MAITMKCRLVQLFSLGVRRPRHELRADPGLVGNLVVRDFEARHNVERRTMKTADLLALHTSPGYPPAPMLKPLFDVTLLRATSRGMLLRGFQVHAEGDRTTHLAQEWWCELDPPA